MVGGGKLGKLISSYGFCSNMLEKIRNYGKVRRKKYGASIGIYGDNKDTCEKEQVWKCIRGNIWRRMKKYGD